MKKLILLFCALQCIFLCACRHSDSHTSIQYTDNDNAYSMNAWFSKSKTKKAERYMNEKIGRETNVSFFNKKMDVVLTLDDGSKFYLKKKPGHIVIKMNKDETSEQAYHSIKTMCKGMKDVVFRER